MTLSTWSQRSSDRKQEWPTRLIWTALRLWILWRGSCCPGNSWNLKKWKTKLVVSLCRASSPWQSKEAQNYTLWMKRAFHSMLLLLTEPHLPPKPLSFNQHRKCYFLKPHFPITSSSSLRHSHLVIQCSNVSSHRHPTISWSSNSQTSPHNTNLSFIHLHFHSFVMRKSNCLCSARSPPN